MPVVKRLSISHVSISTQQGDVTRRPGGESVSLREDGSPVVVAIKFTPKRTEAYRPTKGFHADLPQFVIDVLDRKEVEGDTLQEVEAAIRQAFRDWAMLANQREKVIGVQVEGDSRRPDWSTAASVSLTLRFTVAVRTTLNGVATLFHEREYEHAGEQRIQRSRVTGHDFDGFVWIEHTDEREAKITAISEALKNLRAQIAAFVGQSEAPEGRPRFAYSDAEKQAARDELTERRTADAERVARLLDSTPLPKLLGMSGGLMLGPASEPPDDDGSPDDFGPA